jgi:hypothetical protein
VLTARRQEEAQKKRTMAFVAGYVSKRPLYAAVELRERIGSYLTRRGGISVP